MRSGFGGVCCVCDDERWLPVMVEACYDAVDRLFFLVNSHAWNGETASNAATLAGIRSCPDPAHKVVIIEGNWSSQHDQRNAGLAICAEARLPFCFVVDADEIYDTNMLAFMMEAVRLRPTADVWRIPQITYWKSLHYRIDTTGHNGQVGFVRVGDVSFVQRRDTDAQAIDYIPKQWGVCHHLSYVRTDAEVLKKIARSGCSRSFRPDWYTNVWCRWDEDPGLQNLHPLRPQWFPRAVRQDLQAYPEVLRRRL